jgi:hypothetical protein
MDLVVQARSRLAAGGNVSDGVPTGGENPVVDYVRNDARVRQRLRALAPRAGAAAWGRLAPDGR